jgi:hypothetical protein
VIIKINFTGRRLLLIGIALLGFGLRSVGTNWDQSQHLNPDERFLTMVLSAMKWSGWETFFETTISTLNPINVGYDFFVYGTFPLFLNKILATLLAKPDYNGYLLVGRGLSALADTGTIFLVYLLARNISSDGEEEGTKNDSIRIGLLAAFLYAVSVIPIQNSHFFIVDTFANFFGFMAIFWLYKFWQRDRLVYSLFMGVSLGLALACKLSLALIIPGLGTGILLIAALKFKTIKNPFRLSSMVLKIFVFAVFTYGAFRVGMPYAFKDYSLTRLDPSFIRNSKTVSLMVKGEIDMPPSIQWAKTNFIWPFQEIFLWGWGPIMGVGIFLSVGFLSALVIREKNSKLFILMLLGSVPFFYQANLLAKAQRYFLGAYPILAIFTAYWMVRARNIKPFKFIFPLMWATALVWAFSFVRIYQVPHTRIAASEWIYKSIPYGSHIGWEHWDDPLPLLIMGHNGSEYIGVEMSLYDNETIDKREKLIMDLEKADYIILSSNRLYGSIPKIPERYPLATLYYKLLFSGRLGFSKIAEFTSYPGIWHFRINDDFAEEPFTVYDHPKVTIFAKNSYFSQALVRSHFEKVDLTEVQQILPSQTRPKFIFFGK